VLSQRYDVLDLLGKGGMGAVYRAHDRLTGQAIALKRVERTSDGISTTAPTEDNELRTALAQEFRVLASLRHPNIVSVLDYGFDEVRQPYFTMELLEGGDHIDKVAQGRPLDEQLQLMVQMLQALVYLHRHGVLHRDLKPSNVLVIDNTVKVLDFGLALFENTEDSALGTLPYMAPELLYGKRADERADLYAVGLIIYEILVGEHPFEDENRSQLVTNILSAHPDLKPLSPQMRPILHRLLQKEPDGRYSSASEVIDALHRAHSMNRPRETTASRESFLQAARMVDREAEREQLHDALGGALRERGSVWLIGGESGVGKSRLLDELRTAALVRGAQVVRGETLSEGANPYSLWREPLRYLALVSELDALATSTLKPILPDIATLLNRPVEDPPPLDPEATATRLTAVIETMLRGLEQPLVILLEDLHFAGEESLALLNNLARLAARLNLLVIGSFRNDENPTLPESLPLAHHMTLPRLPREDISELAVAMLGDIGSNPDLVDLLDRETQGNLFFIVEVVRALAEEAGELDSITEINLHRRVLTGGVRQIIQRRLARVPDWARDLLKIAAALGRQIDRDLLAAISPQTNLTGWINTCAHVVLAAQGDDWIFAHDKLRDALLQDIEESELRAIHRCIAEAIEATRPVKDSAVQLTYHWSMAGDPAKEGTYARMAGEEAYRNGAWNEALTLLARAYTLRNALNLSNLEAASLQRLQADVCYRMGNLNDSRKHLRRAAADLEWSMPENTAEMSAKLIREVTRQFGHRTMPIFRRSQRPREWLLETHRIAMIEAEIAFFRNETTSMLVYGVGALNQAEVAGISPELAKGSANMCYAVSNVGQAGLAGIYKRQARRVADQVGDPAVQEFALRRTSLLDIGLGKWEDAEDALQRALEYAAALGDLQAREEDLDFLASLFYYRGQFEQSRDLFAEVHATAVRTSNQLHQSWGLLGQGQNCLRLGQLERANDFLRQALVILEGGAVNDLLTLIQAYGLLAVTEAYRGRMTEADFLVQESREKLGKSEPTGFALLEGYAGGAETELIMIEQLTPDDPLRATLIERANESVARLVALAKTIPIARPRARVLTGWLAHLTGDSSALEQLRAAVKYADVIQMPFELAFAQYHLGRLSDIANPARTEALGIACALFARLGCKHHLESAKTALDAAISEQQTEVA
jgi:eukaryotic-like serine/threonine-protein kinase